MSYFLPWLLELLERELDEWLASLELARLLELDALELAELDDLDELAELDEWWSSSRLSSSSDRLDELLLFALDDEPLDAELDE